MNEATAHLSCESVDDSMSAFNLMNSGRKTPGLKSLIRFFCFLCVTFYLPVTLFWLGIVPFEYRFHVTAVLVSSALLFCMARRHKWKDLGFRSDNLKESLFWNGLICAIGGVILYVLYVKGFSRSHHIKLMPVFYVAYIFVLVPAQEFFFRGLLFAELNKTPLSHNRWALLLISAVSFCFLHVIYGHHAFVAITFLAGLIWGMIYERFPNFWGVSMSHSVLGVTAFYLGIL